MYVYNNYIYIQALDPLPIFGIGMQALYTSTGAGDSKTLEEAVVAKVGVWRDNEKERQSERTIERETERERASERASERLRERERERERESVCVRECDG